MCILKRRLSFLFFFSLFLCLIVAATFWDICLGILSWCSGDSDPPFSTAGSWSWKIQHKTWHELTTISNIYLIMGMYCIVIQLDMCVVTGLAWHARLARVSAATLCSVLPLGTSTARTTGPGPASSRSSRYQGSLLNFNSLWQSYMASHFPVK